MINFIALTFGLLMFFQPKHQSRNTISNDSKFTLAQIKHELKQDSLFQLNIDRRKKLVNIIVPKNSTFQFPDNTAKNKVIKLGDFNADNKEDVLVKLGGCGTGGCICGLFLKQRDNYYKLALLEYLKNIEFKIAKNGSWMIESSEPVEAYNPLKSQITVYKFDKKKYQYVLDTSYLKIDHD